jgi:hypothetical protein
MKLYLKNFYINRFLTRINYYFHNSAINLHYSNQRTKNLLTFGDLIIEAT